MKKIFLLSFLVIFLTAACGQEVSESSFKTININNQQLKVEIADTSAKQMQGLSNRQSLAADQGMLFVFNNYTRPGFWMKDMQFAIDIIWIKDDIIVDIAKEVPIPEDDNLKNYFPSEDINYVLEVNAGWAESKNVKIGDKVEGF